MKKNILILIFTFLTLNLCSQNSKFDSLYVLFQNTKNDSIYIKLCIEISTETRRNNSDTSIYFAKLALNRSQKIGFSDGIANSFLRIGWAYFYKGQIDTAINYKKKAYNIYFNLDDSLNITKTNFALAKSYQFMGTYSIALKHYFECLKYYEKVKDSSWIAGIYNNIGIIYTDLKYFDKAKNVDSIILQIRLKQGLQEPIAASYYNLAIDYKELGDTSKSLAYHYKALKIRESINFLSEIAMSCNSIAKIMIETKKYSLANYYLERALKIDLEIDYKDGLFSDYLSFATLYLALNDLNKSLENAKQAYKYAVLSGFQNGF